VGSVDQPILDVGRASRAAGIGVAAVAFVAIGVATKLGVTPIRSYGVLFVAVFVWLGLHHPPRSSLRVLPLFVPAYVIPVLDATPRFDPRALAIAAATCVFVAEVIAWNRTQTRTEQHRADATARAFRVVATASSSLQQLNPDAVLDAVVDAVMTLGYEAANLVLIDDATESFVLAHPRGISVQLGVDRHPLGTGLTSQVRASRRTLVVDDYATWEHAIDVYRDCGVRAMIGVPILAGSHLVGVLVASTARTRTIPPAELDPLEALAAVASAALANVELFRTERQAVLAQTEAAMTDGLTGLANRRRADATLETMLPGTAVVMIDLDHFGLVNERLGHAGGDEALRRIAAHLAAGLREGDLLARFGGEEFVLLLPGTGVAAAMRIVERLGATWRATDLSTTFSAGVACHRLGAVAETLARADAALYEAKRSGRDRCLAEEPLAAA
jgi:diguanylate cyclase (GGDEF)-like protein